MLEGGHSAVLPVELCNQVGDILNKRMRQYNRRLGLTRVYLLSSILYCGVCGRKMRGVQDHGLVIYRHCGAKGQCTEKWVYVADAEREVLDYLRHLNNPDLINYVETIHQRELQNSLNKSDNSQLLNSLKAQQEKLNRLEDLYLDGEIDKDRYKLRKLEISQRIKQLESEVYTDEPIMNLGETVTQLLETLSRIDAGEPETQKILINSVFERIEIIGGKVGRYTPREWARVFFDISSKVGLTPPRPTIRTKIPVSLPL